MSDFLDLGEIERLEKGASPVPWLEAASWPDIIVKDDRQTIVAEVTGGPSNPTARADRALIVALRNIAPELLRRARRADELEEVLLDVEWEPDGFCPWCCRSKESGHDDECALGAALESGAGRA